LQEENRRIEEDIQLKNKQIEESKEFQGKDADEFVENKNYNESNETKYVKEI